MKYHTLKLALVAPLLLASISFSNAYANEKDLKLTSVSENSVVKLYDPYVSIGLDSYKDGSFSENLKLGTRLSKNIYASTKLIYDASDAFSVSETLGFVEHFKAIDEYAEASYACGDIKKFLKWRDNTNYDFGIRAHIKHQYSVFIQTDDTFNKNDSRYKTGAGFTFTNNWMIDASYTSSSKNDPHGFVSVDAGYIF